MGLCLFSSVLNETVKNDIKLEELRRGAIVGQKRQGMQWHELEDLEDAIMMWDEESTKTAKLNN